MGLPNEVTMCISNSEGQTAATTSAVITDDSKLTFGSCQSGPKDGDERQTWLLVNTLMPLITLTDSFLSGTDSSCRIHFLSVE